LKTVIPKHVVRSLIVFVTLALCTPVFGQSTPDNPFIAKGKKAYSIPVSDRNIQFQVTVPSGDVVVLLVQEGGMAKIYNSNEGYSYAMVPIVKDINNKSADFAICRITQDKDGNESIQELEHVTANFNEASPTKVEPKLQIKLIKIAPPKL